MRSFKHAISGLVAGAKDEKNLKFHIFAAVSVTLLGIVFNITKEEWLVILLVIGLVICLELVNTAVEEIVDSFTQNQHPGAKKAKDVCAGAVLLASIISVVIGLVIFLPYFSALLVK